MRHFRTDTVRLLLFLIALMAGAVVLSCHPATTTKELSAPAPDYPAPKDMVWVPGGTFTMGSDEGPDDERPAHAVRVNGFWIDQYEVTNAQFAKFIDATSYVTSAEKPLPAT